jgi:hypothetical protein
MLRVSSPPWGRGPRRGGYPLKHDVSKKLAGDGFKLPWPPLIKRDAAVKAKVEVLFRTVR